MRSWTWKRGGSAAPRSSPSLHLDEQPAGPVRRSEAQAHPLGAVFLRLEALVECAVLAQRSARRSRGRDVANAAARFDEEDELPARETREGVVRRSRADLGSLSVAVDRADGKVHRDAIEVVCVD